MNSSQRAPKPQQPFFDFPYFSIRNITSPEDSDNQRWIYVGHAPLSAIVDLTTNENVRDYIPDAGKKKSYSGVHRAIQDTLINRPEEFAVLNSGVVLVARAIEVDDKQKRATLKEPSIINGSQTQGVLKDYIEKYNRIPTTTSDQPIHIKFEIVVTSDEDLIANVSIARNFQNEVLPISIAGRQGHLDELESYFRKVHPNLRLRKSETERVDPDNPENDLVWTERLIQIIAALVPESLYVKGGEFNKVYTYSQKTKCLRDFQQIYKIVKEDPTHPEHTRYQELYQFYLDIAGQAYDLYETWKKHPGFKGTGLHSIERDRRGNIEEVPDGIIFPILASLSVFAQKTENGWIIRNEGIDLELIQNAKITYTDVAKHNPNVMGKSKACYAQLLQITSLISRYKQPALS